MMNPGLKKNKKICIIGSGPNGIAAIKPFLKYSDKFDITLISRGNLDFHKSFNKKINIINKLTTDEKHIYWIQKENYSADLIPKKLFFNNSKIYNNKDTEFFVEKNISLDVCYQIGGLSNVWGANVCDVSNNDLKKYKKSFEYKGFFLKTITSDIKIAGEKDNIDNYLCNIFYHKKKLNYSSQAKNLKNLFIKNYHYFKKNNFRLGYAKLAINTENEKNECENCGLCMFGCHKNSIYNSTSELKNILKQINFFENTKVEHLTEVNKKVIINLVNEKTKNKYTLEFDKVLIAAGAIDTSILALKFLEKYNKKTLTIRNSNKYFFLYFTKKKNLSNEEKRTIGLSQIFMQTEIEGHTFHLQLYDSNILFKLILKNFFSKKIVDKIFKFLSFIFDRLMLGVIYFPSEISDEMTIEKKNLKFFIKKKRNKNFYIYKLFCKLYKYSIKINSFPIPFFLKGKTGVSQHFGSSLPMSNGSKIGKCDSNGLLNGSNNVYIIDSSCLTRIPSTPPTFLTMSNATRISNKIIKNNL